MSLIWRLSSGPIALPSGWAWELATNFAHGPFFGVLAVLAARAADARPGAASGRSLGLGFAVALAWGVTDEWHQSRVPGRTTSLFDLLTDATGAAAAVALLALAHRRASAAAAARGVALGVAAVLVSAALATAFG
ncbi:MAG: hypothetical protein DCC71_09470 [Proteobacteria bacterium]|nr:MAG: hypothetical protein DCC71_09470 [Pseudomonadota bacterium]